MLATGTAILLGSIISALIGAAASVGISVGTTESEKNLIKKAEQNKCTYSDVIKLVDDLTRKSRGLSTAQQNALANKMSNIFSNPVYSSGQSEQLMADLRHRVDQVKQEIDQHVTMGNAYNSAAETQAAALSGMAPNERAKAKKEDGSWDLDTAAGRAASESERLADLAAQEFDKAKSLGEKYV